MSSDSDADEFYDAEEQTPARLGRLHVSHVSGGSGESTEQDLRAIEEEEKRLFELKKSAAEKRQKEDEEIQRRMEELEEKKKIEAERRAAGLEQRRKKLEEMRMAIAEENTPQRQQETVLLSESHENTEETDDVVVSESVPSVTVTGSGRGGDDALRVRLEFEEDPRMEEADLDANRGDNQSCDRENIENEQRLNNERLDGASAPAVEAAKPNVPSVVSNVCEPEPDIIQSTKRPIDLPVAAPRVNPADVASPPPKAPPRTKKRKPKPVVEGAEGGVVEPKEKVHSPTSATILHLTKDFENSLDLSSATSGAMMVETKDDDAAKAEKAEDEDSEKGSLRSEDIANTRPRSNSGRFLTDTEILEQVSVLNLDTGEKIPLSLAEDKLPRCMNPLSLHIMRRTKEYSSDSSLHKEEQSDDEGDHKTGTLSTQATAIKKKGIRLGKFLGKKMEHTVAKIKHAAEEVLQKEESESDDEEIDGKKQIKIKASRSNNGPYDFLNLKPIQDLGGEHTGAVWTMKFSHCGRLLASGGQDNVLRVWVLKESCAYFDEMRQKYTKMSPAPSENSLNSEEREHMPEISADAMSRSSVQTEVEGASGVMEEDEYRNAPFARKPFCSYRGHTADLLDLSWSKNYFILSSSMDKTVRLWHISRRECLCCFQHIDFVTAIAFHPRDDRYFLSGSLDGKIRLWNIPDKKVALWNEVQGNSKLITAANFCQNGKFAVVGTYDGRVIFYNTEQMKYYTQIHARSTRGKNARGRKITGIEPLPGQDKVLVTSNDSRLRLYDLRDLTLHCKYKGCANNSSQIKASFSSNGKYIVCGSEDKFVYIWKTHHEFTKFSSVRRDRNGYWEGVRAHLAVVTVAIFSPNPSLIIKRRSAPEVADEGEKTEKKDHPGEVFVSADFSGAIKVFKNKFKPPPVKS
ncbi:WD repeat-containing protein 44-like isoform X2 [Lineus longissimus]|uniref:WD repeat-containing protein 44-like isoform X2 n=1 Tax=Lineus longissimus TaxID=88925 RepID=UPI00315D25CB